MPVYVVYVLFIIHCHYFICIYLFVYPFDKNYQTHCKKSVLPTCRGKKMRSGVWSWPGARLWNRCNSLLLFSLSPSSPTSLFTSDRPIHWTLQGLKKSRIVSHALDPLRQPAFFMIGNSLAPVPFRDERKLNCEDTAAKRASWCGSAILSPHTGVEETDTKHTSLSLNA